MTSASASVPALVGLINESGANVRGPIEGGPQPLEAPPSGSRDRVHLTIL